MPRGFPTVVFSTMASLTGADTLWAYLLCVGIENMGNDAAQFTV